MSAPEEPPRPRTANWIVTGLIGMFGVVGFTLAVRSGRTDSALLFVGLPVLLAVVLAMTPARTAHGRVFLFTTVCLLLASVALQEGAVCVILAAPLVYGVVHGTTALIHWWRSANRPYYAVAVLPLLLAGGVEGSTDGLRIDPEQSVQVVRRITLPADQFAERIAAGPKPVPVRSVPLRLLGVPLPRQVSGDGLAVGDRWVFAYHGSSHGPGGHLVVEVERAEPGRIGFRFTEDTSITARWVTWRRAELNWRAVDSGQTEVRVTAAYQRGLDPSWYFGPVQDALMHEGAGHLLDMLALT
ncbi:SRPBCC family protein [Plantactinospora sonchi]|uniref:SRPBCC family protein n=1 Tax=Plantactinospora sonchi TaxID=1544735 RepID=A0ABU7RRZ5_9ACTN